MTSTFKISGSEGAEIYGLVKRLFPICRSLTGRGVRESLRVFQEYLPLKMVEVPTGKKVLDWTIPKEWNIKDAYIKNKAGQRIVDFKKNNLHVVGYSSPIREKMKLAELKKHIHTLPHQPDSIPYATSYYKNYWGFCMSERQFKTLKDETYDVAIDSTLTQGTLTYGEYVMKGQLKDEFLLSTYICHPSLANDNLSGPALTAVLAAYLSKFKLKYTYRFLFIPETIGAIAWLSQNEKTLSKIKQGLVVTCVGDKGKSTYKKTRAGNHLIDRAVEKVLIDSGEEYLIRDFWPQGSDERQFSSPSYNMAVGSLMRTPYGCYPEYHTSADNLDFITASDLQNTFEKYIQTLDIIEHNGVYMNLIGKGEPQLGKRGLYGNVGGQNQLNKRLEAQAWVLNFSDGQHSLLDIAYKSRLRFELIRDVVPPLLEHGILKKIE